MRKSSLFVISVIALLGSLLAGCNNSGEIGQAQIDAAYPKATEEEIKSTLAKENPEALKEYEAQQARDKAYQEAGQASVGGGEQGAEPNVKQGQ